MQGGYEVFFVDEASFMLMDYKIYGWYRKGSRPVKPHAFYSGWSMKLIGALSTKGFVVSKQYEKVDSQAFLHFLKQLHEHFPKLVIAMDNVSLHYTQMMRDWYEKEGIEIIKIKKYIPQLNPIEHYWKNIKQWLGSIQPLTRISLIKALELAMNNKKLCPNSSD